MCYYGLACLHSGLVVGVYERHSAPTFYGSDPKNVWLLWGEDKRIVRCMGLLEIVGDLGSLLVWYSMPI